MRTFSIRAVGSMRSVDFVKRLVLNCFVKWENFSLFANDVTKVLFALVLLQFLHLKLLENFIVDCDAYI